MGFAPSIIPVIFSSLSSSIFIALPLLAHVVSIVKVWTLFLNFPCTKGVAKASTAQAAKNRSPVLSVIRCPVSSSDRG